MDGFADDGEMALLAASPPVSPPYFYNSLPIDLTVDDAHFVWTRVVPLSAQGAGDVASPDPVTTTTRVSLQTFGPAIVAAQHRVTVDVRYSVPTFTDHLSLTLPAGATGNATMSTHIPTSGQGFDLPANATMTSSSSNSWSMDVGWAPASITGQSTARLTVNAVQGSPVSLGTVLTIALIVIVPVVAVVAALVLLRRRRNKPAAMGTAPTPPPAP